MVGGFGRTAGRRCPFRAEFGEACALAGADLGARWSDWWTGCVRRAADELMRAATGQCSDDDVASAALRIRLRLERAADFYRRMLCLEAYAWPETEYMCLCVCLPLPTHMPPPPAIQWGCTHRVCTCNAPSLLT